MTETNGKKESTETTVSNMSMTTKLILGLALGVAGVITGINTYQIPQSSTPSGHTQAQEAECIKEREKLETRILRHVQTVKDSIDKEDGHLKDTQQDLLRQLTQLHEELADNRDKINELDTQCKLGQQIDKALLERCEDCRQRILEHEKQKHGTAKGGLEYDIYSGAIFNTLTGVLSK